jgi:hypothetical protein
MNTTCITSSLTGHRCFVQQTEVDAPTGGYYTVNDNRRGCINITQTTLQLFNVGHRRLQHYNRVNDVWLCDTNECNVNIETLKRQYPSNTRVTAYGLRRASGEKHDVSVDGTDEYDIYDTNEIDKARLVVFTSTTSRPVIHFFAISSTIFILFLL